MKPGAQPRTRLGLADPQTGLIPGPQHLTGSVKPRSRPDPMNSGSGTATQGFHQKVNHRYHPVWLTHNISLVKELSLLKYPVKTRRVSTSSNVQKLTQSQRVINNQGNMISSMTDPKEREIYELFLEQ